MFEANRRTARLAALLAAALLPAGCAGLGSDATPDAPPPRPPVVVVVFDEFPADALLRPDGRIDADRFPNFAKLASMSTWFPNAHTVFDSTFGAVPAILDGRLPRPRTAADVRSHQPSVFHLMDRLGYDIFKVESASAVCPPRICVGARARRPGILSRLAGSGRPARFHRWVGAIRRRSHPALYLHHALLPHEPWLYLPSGRQSHPSGREPIKGINKPPGFGDPALSAHNHLRHLLQVGFTDRLLGDLLARLSRTRLLPGALLIVTADHGYSFDVGVTSRRWVSKGNVDEIAPVPLFVKTPGQLEGRTDRRLARNIDLVATVADVLDTRVFWKQDGRSLLADSAPESGMVALRTRDFADEVRIDLKALERRRAERRRRRAQAFGTGSQSRRLYGDPWALAYRIGPNRHLLGRRVTSLDVTRSASARASGLNPWLARRATRSRETPPLRVTGSLEGVPAGEHRDIAVAVNGRIRAVGRSFELWRQSGEHFSVLVPEHSLKPRGNRLQLFEVRPDGALALLAPRPYRTL